jgi:hypothetical protein
MTLRNKIAHAFVASFIVAGVPAAAFVANAIAG